MEVSKRWYIGGGKQGEIRLRNIQRLADLYFQGNVSKLVNDALNRLYNLDPDSGQPQKPLTPPPQPKHF
jgi:hypothetical protein